MSQGSVIGAASSCPSLPARPGRLRIFLDLTKARLSGLVLLTTAVGYVLALPRGASIDWVTFLWTLLGTAMAAGSASALNQILEVERDRRMRRTAGRPLPAGTLGRAHATALAIGLGAAGMVTLAALVNLAAAGLALLTTLLYVLVYTPLKPRTSLNTLVGAVCGAIPPLIGWVATSRALEPGAWLLAALLFIWQLPHFLALAWLYRDDYARGGFRMLPNVDPRGWLTGQVAVLGCLLLLLVGFLGLTIGLAGWVCGAGTMFLGVWMLDRGLRFWRLRTDGAARRLFRASLVYLSLVLALLLIDRGPIPQLEPAAIAGPAPRQMPTP